MLACGYGKLETETGTEDFSIAILTTLYLTQGKLMIILQAGRIQSEKDLPAFTRKALRIAAEIAGQKTPSRKPTKMSSPASWAKNNPCVMSITKSPAF